MCAKCEHEFRLFPIHSTNRNSICHRLFLSDRIHQSDVVNQCRRRRLHFSPLEIFQYTRPRGFDGNNKDFRKAPDVRDSPIRRRRRHIAPSIEVASPFWALSVPSKFKIHFSVAFSLDNSPLLLNYFFRYFAKTSSPRVVRESCEEIKQSGMWLSFNLIQI